MRDAPLHIASLVRQLAKAQVSAWVVRIDGQDGAKLGIRIVKVRLGQERFGQAKTRGDLIGVRALDGSSKIRKGSFWIVQKQDQALEVGPARVVWIEFLRARQTAP